MKRSLNEVMTIQRQILDAHEALEAERAADVKVARDNVRLLLGQHGLFVASFAMRRDPGYQTFREFHTMVSHMRAGGFHRVRENGGRGIDG